jgi:AraC family transcriptional regulator
MLRYLGFGDRRFGLYPLKPLVRMNWEFFAVLAGRCGPRLSADAPAGELSETTFWVFPPGSAHVWAGNRHEAAQVAVFHFGSVPAQLAAAVREHGHLALPLEPEECCRLADLARQLQTDFRRPTNFSNLVFQGALIELTLLALRKLPERSAPLPQGHAKQIVDAATTWFADNVRDNPSIKDVAARLHVSASTLRRAFQQTVRERPVKVFARIQLEAAMRLMTETTLKLDTIAGECGFSSTSDFCRAFKAYTKVSPNLWRRTILAPPRAAVDEGKPSGHGAEPPR